MAYYRDLTRRFGLRRVFNVGWLNWQYPFETGHPTNWLIRKLWLHSKYMFNSSRGYHECNLPNCSGPARKSRIRDKAAQLLRLEEEIARAKKQMQKVPEPRRFRRLVLERLEDSLRIVQDGYSGMNYGIHPDTGERIGLGSAVIMVFGKEGIYVAPNLIYHYVTIHHYKPPEEFLRALKHSPSPPDPEYVACLDAIGYPRRFLQVDQWHWQQIDKKKAAQRKKSR